MSIQGYVPVASMHGTSSLVQIPNDVDLSNPASVREILQRLIDRDHYIYSNLFDGYEECRFTEDGGFAIKCLNTTGAPTVKGTVVSLITGGVAYHGDTYSSLGPTVIAGATHANTDYGRIYVKIDGGSTNSRVRWYSDAAMTTLVAHGALTGHAAGTITLSADGGSGLTGTQAVLANPPDNLTGCYVDNYIQGGLSITGTSGNDSIGVMYSDGDAVAPATCYVTIAGCAKVLLKNSTGAMCKDWLMTSGTAVGRVEGALVLDKTKLNQLVGRATVRNGGGTDQLVGCQLMLNNQIFLPALPTADGAYNLSIATLVPSWTVDTTP